MTAPDPEAEYYQAIEEFFVSRRGDPLFLSNADWLLIRRWRESGLPLRVVQRGIADAMDSHEHSWSRKQKVGSLRYCAAEVDASAARWHEALQGGQDEPALSGVLEQLAAELRQAEGLLGETRREADAVAAELLERARSGADGEALEAWLRGAEARILASIEKETGEIEKRALDEEVERDLAPYGSRLPQKVLAQIKGESRTRRLLERHGLPRLSLWTL